MNTFVLCSVLLSYALLIDAGLVRVRRDDPLTNYDDVFVGQASGLNPVSTQFGGSSGSFSGSSSFGGSISHTSPIRQEAIISETNNPPGTLGDNSDFSYAFETENGIKQQVVGSTIDVGGKSVVVMKGSYEYIGDDGQIYVVDWIADENGFQPSGPHIPKEIVDAVQAQIVFASDGGSSFNSGSSSGSSFNDNSPLNTGFSSGSNFNGGFSLNSGSPTGSNFNSDSSFNPGSSTTSIINDDSLLNTGFSSGSNFNVGSSLNSGSHSGSNFNSDSSFNPGASSGSSFNGDSSFNPESSIGSSFNGDSSFNPGSSFNGDSSFNPGSFSDSSFNSGSGNGFQGQFNGFEGQFDEFEGQLDGFQGQFDEFEGQLDGFEGQSIRLNSIGAASRNFPFNTSPILPSYPS